MWEKIQNLAVIARKRLLSNADGIAGGLPVHTSWRGRTPQPRSYREEIQDVSACIRAADVPAG